MLQITVPSSELFDEKTESFVHTNETQLKLEHSLLSISKWESKWCKPFLSSNPNEKRTSEEMLDYIRCMTLNTVPTNVYSALTPKNLKDIGDYIKSPMTATTVTNLKKSNKRETITSELIYYWMIACNIPFECEKWHLNRLFMLIRVCNAMNSNEKMSKRELASRNRALNAARRKALHTRG